MRIALQLSLWYLTIFAPRDAIVTLVRRMGSPARIVRSNPITIMAIAKKERGKENGTLVVKLTR